MSDAAIPGGVGLSMRRTPPGRNRSALMLWAPTAAGLALFAAAWIRSSAPLMHAGTVVTSLGLIWIPVALFLQRRLASQPAWLVVLGTVLVVQGLHTVEHIVQIIESYRLDYPPVRSLGVVSSLNVEWVHFSWNWIATAGVLIAMAKGGRTWATWLLLGWITAHSLEHTYLLVRYLQVTRELDRLGVPRLGSSEVLPGFFGRDGWLSLHGEPIRPLLGPFASAPRVAVHLWWNLGEVALLGLGVCIRPRVRASSGVAGERAAGERAGEGALGLAGA